MWGESGNYTLEVYQRVTPNFDAKALIESSIKTLVARAEKRKKIVTEGYAYCSKNSCKKGSAAWDEWSTPIRDGRDGLFIKDLIKTVVAMKDALPEIGKQWKKDLLKPIVELDGVDYNLNQYIYTWLFKNFESEPSATPARRWGISEEGLSQSFFERMSTLLKQRVEITAKQADTYKLDKEIQQLGLARLQYCEVFSLEQCQNLEKTLKDTSIKVGDHKRDLDHWLKRSPWFNSDPRASADIRWGSYYDKALPIPFAYTSITMAKNHWAILYQGYAQKERKRVFYDIPKQREIEAPEGFTLSQLETLRRLAIHDFGR